MSDTVAYPHETETVLKPLFQEEDNILIDGHPDWVFFTRLSAETALHKFVGRHSSGLVCYIYTDFTTHQDLSVLARKLTSDKNVVTRLMTRDEAHSYGFDSPEYMNWVMANKDQIGLKAPWQTAAETQAKLIDSVRIGKK